MEFPESKVPPPSPIPRAELAPGLEISRIVKVRPPACRPPSLPSSHYMPVPAAGLRASAASALGACRRQRHRSPAACQSSAALPVQGCWQLSGGHVGERDSDRTSGAAAVEDFQAFVDAGITTFDTGAFACAFC